MPTTADSLSETSTAWRVDFSTAFDQLVLVYLFALSCAFVALLFTIRHVWRQLQRNRSLFWQASMLGVILLVPTPFGEFGFTLAMWSRGTLWTYPPLLSFVVTAFVRIGYGCVTICRLYRLYLISRTRPIDAKRRFRLLSVLLTFVITINISSSAALRIIETVHNRSGAVQSEESIDTVEFYREQHKYFGFVTFMVVHVTNLVCDYLFAKRVMASARLAAARGDTGTGGIGRLRREDVVRLTLPYVPPAATTLLYVVVSLMTLVDGERWGRAMYFSIGLNRLAPLVESACFYLWSVGHTRVLLKALSLSQTNKSSTSVGGHGAVSAVTYTPPTARSATTHAELDLALAVQIDSYYAKSVYAQGSPVAPPAYTPASMAMVASGTAGTMGTASTATAESAEGWREVPPVVPRVYTPPQRTRDVPRSPQPQVRMHF